MNGFLPDARRDRRSKPQGFGSAALLCLALLTLLALAQVAHMHPFEQDADHCQLCIAMHTAAPVAVVEMVVVLVPMGVPAPVFEPLTVVKHRHPKLYTRPPPASC